MVNWPAAQHVEIGMENMSCVVHSNSHRAIDLTRHCITLFMLHIFIHIRFEGFLNLGYSMLFCQSNQNLLICLLPSSKISRVHCHVMRCPIAGPGGGRRWKPTCSGSKVAGTSMKPGSNLKGQGWPQTEGIPVYWDTADRSNRVSNSGNLAYAICIIST